MQTFLFSFIILTRNAAAGPAAALSASDRSWDAAGDLVESVGSILAQTVGFAEHLQLVLVNNGGADAAGALCRQYSALYPRNVVHLDRPGEGTAAARNAGIQAAAGRFLNVLDVGDRWDAEACEAAWAFFEGSPQVTFLCMPILSVSGRRGGERSNDRFKQGRVASIFLDPEQVVRRLSQCFIGQETCRRRQFEEQLGEQLGEHPGTPLSAAEDLVWLTELLLDERQFGVLDRAGCHLRQPGWLWASGANGLRERCAAILRSAEQRYGTPDGAPLPWAQHEAMACLAGPLCAGAMEVPNRAARQESLQSALRDCLNRIDDRIILRAPGLDTEERMLALALKYGLSFEDLKAWITPLGDRLCCHRPSALPLELTPRLPPLRVEFLDMAAGRLHLRGSCAVLTPRPGFRLVLTMRLPDGRVQDHPCALFRRPDRRKRSLFDNNLWALESFEISLPLEAGAVIQAVVDMNGIPCRPTWTHERLSPLRRGNAASYLARAGHIVGVLPDDQGLWVERASLWQLVCRECAFLQQVRDKLGWFRAARAAGARLLVRLLRRVLRRPLWLIGDRVPVAGDNGEAFFEYLMAHPEKRRGIRPVFVLGRDSADWARLKRIGPTVAANTVAHKLLFLVADKHITSSVNSVVLNPFGSAVWVFHDLFNFDLVFLQHGVIAHDQSAGLNRARQNFALFVTSAQREQQSIAQGDYGYAPEQVILTGLPRHDKLVRPATPEETARETVEQTGPLVLVMPTWRTGLVAGREPGTDQPLLVPGFTRSGYFRFWNTLINHPRLLRALREHRGCLQFAPHPYFASQADRFQAQDPASVVAHSDYTRAFRAAALLLTDYSSVAFDFALLKKPIVYAQFDRETFYAGQAYDRGYFDHARDGFGPVCATLEDTVDAVIHALDKDCVMTAEYSKRVDAFYGPQPTNRCQAVLEAIQGLGRRPL